MLPMSQQNQESIAIICMFEGSLDQMNLAEVVRLLAASNQSGCLKIFQDDYVAALYFNLGHLIHARTPSATGIDALAELVGRSGDRFSLDPGTTADGRSLEEYPTQAVIEQIQEQIREQNEIAASMPALLDIPLYQPGQSVGALALSPRDLSLLLHIDGKRCVEEIAAKGQLSVKHTRVVLAQCIHGGLVKIVGRKSPATESGMARQLSAAPAKSASSTPRYWRGKKID